MFSMWLLMYDVMISFQLTLYSQVASCSQISSKLELCCSSPEQERNQFRM
jgi:hypothetical protein